MLSANEEKKEPNDDYEAVFKSVRLNRADVQSVRIWPAELVIAFKALPIFLLQPANESPANNLLLKQFAVRMHSVAVAEI